MPRPQRDRFYTCRDCRAVWTENRLWVLRERDSGRVVCPTCGGTCDPSKAIVVQRDKANRKR